MENGLGQFAEGFATWRRMLAAVEDVGIRWQIFGNAAHEVAGYVTHGLDRAVAADELQEIGVAYGLVRIDADSVQQIISDAFEQELVPPVDEEQATNGFDHQPVPIEPTATPYVFPEPSAIEPRAWLYAGHYVRGAVSATVAPGGWGKTTLTLFEVLAMAQEGRRVWYISGEDPKVEIDRRIAAHCQHHKVDKSVIGSNLFVDDKRSFSFFIGSSPRNSMVQFDQAWLARLQREIEQKQIDVTALDPFISFHAVPEVDNGAIDQIIKMLALIAQRTNSSIELSHHVRKPQPGIQAALTVDDTRGGGAIINAVRSCRVINRMSEREADLARVAYDKRSSYLRVDKGKRNMAPAEAATWFVLRSVYLPNTDNVQAIEAWEYPNAFDAMSPADVTWVQELLGKGPLRTSSQSPEWLGHALGARFSRDTTSKAGAIWANQVIGKWLQSKVFKKTLLRDPEQRKTFTYFVPNSYTATTTQGATIIPFERQEAADDDHE